MELHQGVPAINGATPSIAKLQFEQNGEKTIEWKIWKALFYVFVWLVGCLFGWVSHWQQI